ncbi:MAG: gliding motility-associated C-terminal domain-containing protein [Flavipsychrobacter sp.]|nr:gliding motility-associated C-terminal domain-containing protein [Flavipsychrobacter sp.]
MHACATHVWVQVPTNHSGYQQPLSGNAYAAAMVAYSPDNHTEYVQGTLNPLTVGTPYRVVVHANLSNTCMYAISDLAVFFFQNGVGANLNNTFYIPVTPQVNYSSYGFVTDTLNWVALTDTIIADSSYSHFIIGNFKNWANTNKVQVNTTGSGRAVYYFDSVSVEPIVVQPLTLTATQVNVLCYNAANGTATANPYGGLPPYTYLWSNGQTTQTASGLAPGTYTCTVTDALSNSATVTVTITQPGSPVAGSISSTSPATCGQQNGSATVTVSGGVPGYLYQWQPYGGNSATASGLAGGTYTCTVADANGCLDTAVAVITQTPAFTLTTAVVNPNCNGGTGTATVTPSGGTQPFTYLWSNGQTTQTATALPAGNYSVTVTDANGCTATVSVVLVQPPPLTLVTTNLQTINCHGYATAIISCGPMGGTGPYSYLWSNGQTSQTVSGLGGGNYSVTVTDSKGCTYTAYVTLTQPPPLVLTTTSVTATSCAQNNGSATVSATGGTPGYTYSWAPYGGTSTTAANLGPGVYVVTVTDDLGCIDTVHVTVPTSTPLSVSLTSSANVSCYGQNNGSASVSVSGGTQPYVYNWSNGATTASVSGLAPGVYSLTVTDANGCAGSLSVTITGPTLLNASVNSVTYPSCNGLNTGSAGVTVTGGTPQYIYLWNNGQTTPIATGLAAGSYTVTVTDANGCTDTAHALVSQPPALTAAISSMADATCSQNNGWATATPSGGTGPYTYLWSNGQTTPTITGLSAGTYTVTITDHHNCTATATVQVSQSAALTLQVAADDISCHGLSDGAAAVTVSTGTQPYTYSWSNGGTTAGISGLAAGSYTLQVTDAIGCPGSATVTITEPAVLTAAITASADVPCHGGQTGSATVAAGGGTQPYTYLWSNGGTAASQANLFAGNYTVTVTDSNGCTAASTITISEPPALLLATQALTGSCANEEQGSAQVTASGGNPPYSFSWNTTPTQNTTTAVGMAPGTYIVTVTDNSNCAQADTVTIAGYSLPGVDAGDDTTICYGRDTAYLQAMGAASYVWSPANGLSCTTCSNPVATPNVSTTYTLTGTDANGCVATDAVTVAVLVKGPTAVGPGKDICLGQSTELFAEGGMSYSWSPAVDMNGETGATPIVSPQVTTTYTVLVKQSDCFTDTLSQTVTVYTPPVVSLGPDRRAVTGTVITLHADTANATSLTWTPPLYLNCYDCTGPEATVEKDIRYVVTVFNGPCSAMDDISILVSCENSDVFCANTFTPNSDGQNDYFFPQSGSRILVAQMAVYDRWGEKVFERSNFFTNEPKDGWDGTYKGKDCNPDTYAYFVQFLCGNGQRIMVKGDINIVK